MIGTLKRLVALNCRPALHGEQPVKAARRPAQQDARGIFFDIVEEVAREERLPFHLAMVRVKADEPEAFRAAFPARRARTGSRVSAYREAEVSAPIHRIRGGEQPQAAMARSVAELPELIAA